MLQTFTTSPLEYKFQDSEIEHVISVQNNATYDFSHDYAVHDGLIELSIPAYDNYVPQQIQAEIFKNCADLSSVEALSVRDIGKKTFYNCEDLRKVNIPLVTTIKDSAFENCNLYVVILSDAIKVTEIQNNTFYNNFRRPISVYIPGNLSDDWYNNEENNNWKYLISSELSVISGDYEDKSYTLVVLSANNTIYNPEVKNIMLSTYNQAQNCKDVWDVLYPNVSEFVSIVNTLSVFAWTVDTGNPPYLTVDDKNNLICALTSDGVDNDLSSIIKSTALSDINIYGKISSDNTVGYYEKLKNIQQFPLHDFDKVNRFEVFRPLSANSRILSNKVDIQSAIDNIYRTSRNTVEELLDIFEPLSTFAYFALSGDEISKSAIKVSLSSTLSTAIEYFDQAFARFTNIIK